MKGQGLNPFKINILPKAIRLDITDIYYGDGSGWFRCHFYFRGTNMEIKSKIISQLEKMSQEELMEHLKTLTEDQVREIQTEFYLAAARHFRDPLHCYENCLLKMSKSQYDKLEKQFAQDQFLFG